MNWVQENYLKKLNSYIPKLGIDIEKKIILSIGSLNTEKKQVKIKKMKPPYNINQI